MKDLRIFFIKMEAKQGTRDNLLIRIPCAALLPLLLGTGDRNPDTPKRNTRLRPQFASFEI